MASLEQKVEQLTERVATLELEVKERWVEIEADPDYDISSLGRVRKRKNGFYPKISIHKSTGYYRIVLNNKSHHIHRLLAQAFIPNPEGKPQVDHIDGDRKNNCLSNLRWATAIENQRNRKKHRNNTSDYTGVTFHKAAGKWQAQISMDGKCRYLGLFDTPEEAAAVYEEAAREEFGEFFCKR